MFGFYHCFMSYIFFSDDSSIEDEEDPDYVFHGNLVAMAFRDVDRKVEFETTVSGRPFLDRSTIKKLRKRHELQAYVNGFAVLTEKRDTCSGKHEVKADLIFSSIDRKEFRMVFQGQIFLESDVLCAIGGDGLVMVEGQATLSFTPDGPSRRKRTVNEFTVKFSSGIIFVIK